MFSDDLITQHIDTNSIGLVGLRSPLFPVTVVAGYLDVSVVCPRILIYI